MKLHIIWKLPVCKEAVQNCSCDYKMCDVLQNPEILNDSVCVVFN